MKRLILSLVFTITFMSNATALAERDCIEEAVIAGNEAEEGGASTEVAYFYANYAYLRCEYGLPN